MNFNELFQKMRELDQPVTEEPNEGNAFSGALDAAKDAGKDEFEVDGKTFQVKEDDVDTVIAPYTEYGLSKYVGEKMSIAFEKQYGVAYTIWRPFNILTPYEKSEGTQGVSHVFADFMNEIIVKRSNVIPMLGDGEQIRCFTWIDEVAEAIATHSFSNKTNGHAFNLGNHEPITMIELAKKIRTIRCGSFLN